MIEPVHRAQRPIERNDAVTLRLRERTTVSSFCKRLQGLDVARFRGKPGLLHAMDIRIADMKMIFDRLERGVARFERLGLGEIDFGQPLDLGLVGSGVFVLSAYKIELGTSHIS